mmetsp:Transcript_126130/g.403652  ORF Transcript_126130/g.403652 Transcript_126130/m.403652 type:complete len:270 (-) Transcript_126130:226-1035(-)
MPFDGAPRDHVAEHKAVEGAAPLVSLQRPGPVEALPPPLAALQRAHNGRKQLHEGAVAEPEGNVAWQHRSIGVDQSHPQYRDEARQPQRWNVLRLGTQTRPGSDHVLRDKIADGGLGDQGLLRRLLLRGGTLLGGALLRLLRDNRLLPVLLVTADSIGVDGLLGRLHWERLFGIDLFSAYMVPFLAPDRQDTAGDNRGVLQVLEPEDPHPVDGGLPANAGHLRGREGDLPKLFLHALQGHEPVVPEALLLHPHELQVPLPLQVPLRVLA